MSFVYDTFSFEEIQDEKVFTPKQIHRYLGSLIESDLKLKNIWVEGEVYNFSQSSSGHIYFSLKEEDTTLDCTYFRRRQSKIFSNHLEIKNGITILAFGDITFYRKNGKCQLNVRKISEGTKESLIFKKIQEIYEKLLKEGIFEESKKKKLPFLPVTIGIATSEYGAVLRDIIQVSRHRFPEINIVIAPCLVQGEEAAESISKAIEILNDPFYQVDVIIAGRGGGSFDDLLPFSEEVVVRAFANSKIPIVSAVGHQINRPLCELAADKAAATPSNAAEIVVPEIQNIKMQLEKLEERIRSLLLTKISNYQSQLKFLLNRRFYQEPIRLLDPYYQYLDELVQKIQQHIENLLKKKSNELRILEEKLKRLNPEDPLQRGYALVLRHATKEIIKNAKEVNEKEMLQIQFSMGSLLAKVIKKST